MRLEGVNEIIRIRIDNWLREMDDPDDRFYAIDNQQVVEPAENYDRVFV